MEAIAKGVYGDAFATVKLVDLDAKFDFLSQVRAEFEDDRRIVRPETGLSGLVEGGGDAAHEARRAARPDGKANKSKAKAAKAAGDEGSSDVAESSETDDASSPSAAVPAGAGGATTGFATKPGGSIVPVSRAQARRAFDPSLLADGPNRAALSGPSLIPSRALGRLNTVGDVTAHVEEQLAKAVAKEARRVALVDNRPTNLHFHN